MTNRTPDQFGALYGEGYISTAEAGRMMGLSRPRVQQEIRDGRLRAEDASRKDAKRPHWRTRPEWVRAWIEARAVNEDAA